MPDDPKGIRKLRTILSTDVKGYRICLLTRKTEGEAKKNIHYQGDRMKKTRLLKKMKLIVLLSVVLCSLLAAAFGSFTRDAWAEDSCSAIDPPLPGTSHCSAYNIWVIITYCYVREYFDGDEEAFQAALYMQFAVMNLDPACAACGDGVCSVGETCPQDCFTACGDGVCRYPEAFECGPDDPPECLECSSDCLFACGNGMCEGPETSESCPQDCTPISTCGNDICDSNENRLTCPFDCAVCGNTICELYEDRFTCPFDCAD